MTFFRNSIKRINSFVTGLDDDIVDLSLRSHVGLESPHVLVHSCRVMSTGNKMKGHNATGSDTDPLLHDEDQDSSGGPSSVGVARKTSVDDYLPHLSPKEEELFKLVESGYAGDVLDFLDDNPDTNVNCLNTCGVSPLVAAVLNEDIEMIRCLLSIGDLEIGDAFLHAVNTGNLEVVDHFLDVCLQIPNRSQVSKRTDTCFFYTGSLGIIITININ